MAADLEDISARVEESREFQELLIRWGLYQHIEGTTEFEELPIRNPRAVALLKEALHQYERFTMLRAVYIDMENNFASYLKKMNETPTVELPGEAPLTPIKDQDKQQDEEQAWETHLVNKRLRRRKLMKWGFIIGIIVYFAYTPFTEWIGTNADLAMTDVGQIIMKAWEDVQQYVGRDPKVMALLGGPAQMDLHTTRSSVREDGATLIFPLVGPRGKAMCTLDIVYVKGVWRVESVTVDPLNGTLLRITPPPHLVEVTPHPPSSPPQ
jgi:hypothetical protein